MIKPSLVLVTSAILLAGCNTPTESVGGKNSENLTNQDNDFFKQITIGNQTEIQSSQLALTQSQSPSVKTFAQHMIDDHQKAGGKVFALAARKGVNPPTQLDTLHTKMIDALKDKSGVDFDKAYADLQVTAHKETISDDQNEIDNGTDPDVKALASELLPTLKMHLDMAKQLNPGT